VSAEYTAQPRCPANANRRANTRQLAISPRNPIAPEIMCIRLCHVMTAGGPAPARLAYVMVLRNAAGERTGTSVTSRRSWSPVTRMEAAASASARR
jgi:hypothetical protein